VVSKINAWLSPVAGTVLGCAAIAAYVVVANAFGDFDPSGSNPTTDVMKVLSVVAFTIFVISPPGLAYVVSRTAGVKVLAPVLVGTLAVALLAFPALYMLSMANQCTIGDSFPIPNVEVCT
jgi:hypothetical protein